MESNEYLLINSKVLPEIFQKVLYAKKILATGEAVNAADAAKKAGISRSAFYKYKDNVFSYSDREKITTVGLRAVLADKAGVFSSLTALLYQSGANLLTANQDRPHDGTAAVSLTLDTENLGITVDELISKVRSLDGIISADAM